MPDAPIAPKRPHTITQHGQTRIDDYFWLRNRDDPAVLDYLKAENDYLDEVLQHTQPLQQQLFAEMKARLKEDDASVPERRGDYFYYTRYETGKQYPLYCRKHDSLDAPEELLLDQNALAEGHDFCRIGAFAVSPDHQTVAYSIDPDGSEVCTIYIKNLVDGSLYPETIPNTFGNVYAHGGVEWANDNRTFFYITRDAATRPYKLYRHVLGTEPAEDVLLYHEADETYYLFLLKSRSQAYIEALSYSTLTTEWRVLSADQPLSEFQVFAPRRSGIEYAIEHHSDRFFVVTNENALNFRLMATLVTATSPNNWREVIPHRSDVLIENALAFENHLVLFERQDGLPQIRLSAADGISDVAYVPFPEPVYSAAPMTNPEFKTDHVRFAYSSLITPNSVIDFHFDTHVWELKKQDEIPSGYDPADYVSERLHAPAPDGTLVPISIVYKKGLEKNGRNPTLLYGYGAYGFTVEASFNSQRLSLIDRGFVFAIGHIRGGSDLGRAWYDGGRMFNKRNSFTDFIACAEHLIATGYTSTPYLAIQGGSAGGLLVGACLTMRPDLYKAVIAEVPFVDVVTTMSDASIPLTTMEYDQWGNPAEQDQFHYLMSYSPYDNIRATNYPDVLITTGLNDPRVAYWEPAKFAAKLRATATNHNLILLKTNMEAGHAGASGRYDYLKEVALEYAFLLDRLTDAK
ncbi:MAG: S9 family peptidase [Anaerolineae bacterium]